LAAAKACIPRITARAEGRPILELAAGKQISNRVRRMDLGEMTRHRVSPSLSAAVAVPRMQTSANPEGWCG